MLVSASAGTGKTTTMIMRIADLIREGADISEIVVVTFTNLAAAEMKAKLAEKLSGMHGDKRAIEQLEKLDTAAICTLHSFCVDLLRNYFYVVDIDPAFAVLDTLTAATLRKNALDSLFGEYFTKDDRVFREVYKIFSTGRREDNFRETLMRLYDFTRCLDDFPTWYEQKRNNFISYGDDNVFALMLGEDIRQLLRYQADKFDELYERASELGLEYADVMRSNAVTLRSIEEKPLQEMLDELYTLKLQAIPAKKRNVEISEYEENIRLNCRQLKKQLDDRIKKYSELYRGERLETLGREMALSVVHVDKLVELINRFDQLFDEEKRRLGGLDFNDLEHMTLALLQDEPTLADIHSRYKMIFVDEYQDTNPVQEAIIQRLAVRDNLFMVGDVKQSIYGFRGCDPDIFVAKRNRYGSDCSGRALTLNDNFRSNVQILQFVNNIFEDLMTEQFGQEDYKNNAKLVGNVPPKLKTASVRVNFIRKTEQEKNEIQEIYDIAAEEQKDDGVKQGELIAAQINEYVGQKYFDDSGRAQTIGYGDVVILMRSMTNRATEIYNTLVAHNIPVAASFKVEGYANKEVRDIINLLRVIDNPYNDVYMVGACLVFGNLSESDLVPVRLDTEGRIPFYDRLRIYAQTGHDAVIAGKIRVFLEFLQDLRFYSGSVSVCETVLYILEKRDYAMAVQSLPDGEMRLGKLYTFIDSLRGASYAQSVDKFLSYVDETEEKDSDVQNVPNAVRLMTIHASKGLEFPIVIVAGLESSFNFDRFSLKTNTRLGIALSYYNFDTMLCSQTLGDFICQLDNERKQREEEMRLLYVAMTRAKYVLDLVATVKDEQLKELPKQANRANSMLDWLMIGLRNKYNGTSEEGVEINIIDNISASELKENDGICEQYVGVDEVRRKLSYRYPYSYDEEVPLKVVSSALDKEYIAGDEEPRAEQGVVLESDRNEVGTAYHKVLQYASWSMEEEQISELIESLVNDGRLDKALADRLDVGLIYQTLHNPELLKIVNNGKVYREIPFMLYAYYDELVADGKPHEQVILQGVIDLLVICDDEAVVIDYKYTNRSDNVGSRYQAQLNSYKLAVRRICGIDNVRCYILSVADNKLIQM